MEALGSAENENLWTTLLLSRDLLMPDAPFSFLPHPDRGDCLISEHPSAESDFAIFNTFTWQNT